jgi:GNAT superfamily N-acetyltransferase
MIVVAEESDLPRVVHGCAEFFDESGLPGQLKVDTWIEFWEESFRNNTGKMWIFEHQGEFCGALAGLFFVNPVNGMLTASELLWYVKPEWRGNTGGTALYRAFEKEAWERGAGMLAVAHLLEGGTPDILRRFYLREGFKPVEKTYMKEL